MLKPHVRILCVGLVAVFAFNKDQEQTKRVKICAQKTIEYMFDQDDTLLFMFDNDSYIFPNYVSNPSMINDFNKESHLLKKSIGHKQNFVMYSKNAEALNATLMNFIRTRTWVANMVPTRKLLLIIPTTDDDDIISVFHLLFQLEFSKFVVLTYDLNTTNSIKLMLGDPLAEPNQCGRSAKLLTTYSCNDPKLIQFPSFLRKYTNCNITYLIGVKHIDTARGTGKTGKTGMKIVDIIVNFFNITLIEKYDNDPSMRLDRFILRMTEINQCRFMSCTRIHAYTRFFFVVPTGKRIPALEALKLVFKTTVWILILLAFVLTSLVWWLFDKLKRSNKTDLTLCLLEVYSMTILGLTKTVRLFWAFRYLFIAYVIYSIHIQAVFTGKLVTLLTVPQFEKSIQSLEELAESNYSIIISKTFLNLINVTDTKHVYTKIRRQFVRYKDDEVYEILLQTNSAMNYTVFTDEESIEIYERTKKLKFNYFVDTSYSSGMKIERSYVRVNPHVGNYEVVSLDSKYYNREFQKMYLNYTRHNISNCTTQVQKFILLITSTTEVAEVFKLLWDYSISNVVVLTYDLQNSIKLMVSDPQAVPNQCGRNVKLITEHSCNDTKLIRFPKILRKYDDCNLTYYSWNEHVYKNVSKSSSLTLNLGSAIAEFFNMTLSIKFMDNFSANHDVFILRLGQICYCVLHNACTDIHEYRSYAWVVPAPKRIPPMETFRLVFKRSVWLLILTTYTATSLIWWLVEKYQKTGNETDLTLCFLKVYSMTLLGLTNTINFFWTLRYLFLAYVIYAIHIQAVFTSKLITLLTVPQYEKEIKSLEALVESNYPIMLPNAYFNVFNFNDTIDIYNKIKNKLVYISDDKFLDLLKHPNSMTNYTVLADNDVLEKASKIHKKTYHYFLDNSYTGSLKILLLMKPLTYSTVSFQKFVTMLIETGAVNKMNRDFDYTDKNFTISVSDKKKLSMEDLYPVFVFWSIGLLFACVLFAGEYLVCAVKRKYLNHT
ncbi:hypothetical protein RN001_010426 [Aquatica leii]|uniref:Ionotropic glutamate receptor C-terminal domain-containing protein n=1 Tax=Aquatica leii TaxID=1421715 RepID=A0AAN7SQB3_9COLE|nr:hypothetical protein RN001_010426 [Aquatica leii]